MCHSRLSLALLTCYPITHLFRIHQQINNLLEGLYKEVPFLRPWIRESEADSLLALTNIMRSRGQKGRGLPSEGQLPN